MRLKNKTIEKKTRFEIFEEVTKNKSTSADYQKEWVRAEDVIQWIHTKIYNVRKRTQTKEQKRAVIYCLEKLEQELGNE